MNEKKIKITIDQDGKISAETLGIEGTACVDELTELLAELGTIEKIEKKPEYYKKVNINNNLKQKLK